MEEEKFSQSFEHDITKANNNYIGWTWRRDRYIWFLTALMHMLLVGDAVKGCASSATNELRSNHSRLWRKQSMSSKRVTAKYLC